MKNRIFVASVIFQLSDNTGHTFPQTTKHAFSSGNAAESWAMNIAPRLAEVLDDANAFAPDYAPHSLAEGYPIPEIIISEMELELARNRSAL